LEKEQTPIGRRNAIGACFMSCDRAIDQQVNVITVDAQERARQAQSVAPCCENESAAHARIAQRA